MIERQGDLFLQSDAEIICITTNGDIRSDGRAVMGRGVARQAAERWPHLPWLLGKALAGGNMTRYLDYVDLDTRRVAIYALPTKQHWREKSQLPLIEASLTLLEAVTRPPYWTREMQVMLPRPGCANGGLLWRDVQPIVAKILQSSRFVVVNRV